MAPPAPLHARMGRRPRHRRQRALLPERAADGNAAIDGARTLGLDKEIGSLEPGKRADMIVVAMKTARQTPLYDPLSHLVYVTRGDDVQTVVVDGKVVMRDRRVTTMNESAVLDEAFEWSRKVRQAVR